MTLRTFMSLSLLDGEKIRVSEKYDAMVIETLREIEDMPEEWVKIHSEPRTPKGLEKCLDRAIMYAHTVQKELAVRAFASVA